MITDFMFWEPSEHNLSQIFREALQEEDRQRLAFTGWTIPVDIVESSPSSPLWAMIALYEPTPQKITLHPERDAEANALISEWVRYGMVGRLVKYGDGPLTVEYCPMEEDGTWGITWYKDSPS